MLVRIVVIVFVVTSDTLYSSQCSFFVCLSVCLFVCLFLCVVCLFVCVVSVAPFDRSALCRIEQEGINEWFPCQDFVDQVSQSHNSSNTRPNMWMSNKEENSLKSTSESAREHESESERERERDGARW